MVMIVMEKVPPRLKGELSRWCQEITGGVFVGGISALVRDLLWDKCVEQAGSGRVYMTYRTNNEQGYAIRIHNDPYRQVVDHEGLLLVQISKDIWKQKYEDFFRV